jgi:hypothetical protein
MDPNKAPYAYRSNSETSQGKESSLKITNFFVLFDCDIIIMISSLKPLCKRWKLGKRLSFTIIHLCQNSFDYAISLKIANVVAILQTLV